MVKIAHRRICLTCQHWNESGNGECLADVKRRHKGPDDTCADWRLARELFLASRKPRDSLWQLARKAQ